MFHRYVLKFLNSGISLMISLACASELSLIYLPIRNIISL
jgi:hypothetical protein